MHKIDFVMLWVDGSDTKWLEEKNNYSPVKTDYSSGDNRFREFDNLQYWFRGIEKYAPWVNNIYFITWGHLPKWLNVNHPKLKIINHKDYIPEEYLPTFNSNTIELNLFRIKELSEHFVLFNDDVFLIDAVKPEDFFKNGLPRDEMIFNPILPKGEKFRIAYTNLNNMNIINEHFDKRKVLKKCAKKIYNIKYGKLMIRSLLLLPWSGLVGFLNPHVGASHLKSTFSLLWEEEHDRLHETCCNRFRGLNDLNHWLMRYWNMCNGNFEPRESKFRKYFNLSNDNTKVCEYIRKQKAKMICINDMDVGIDFEKAKSEINQAFDDILGEKSAFEL
jgi:hypothetical protein